MIKIENNSVVGTVRRLQIGQVMPFAREQVSAINKYAVDKVTVTTTGCIGDEQGDPFFHGGQLQAVHQMPEQVYKLIQTEFPSVTIYEGMLGENLIVSDMHETNVCIGDIFQIGSVQMQITRPRRPCWKIDSQLNQRGVAKFLQEQGCVGWYYRIIKTGDMQLNDNCFLISRAYPFASLTKLWEIYNDKNFRDPNEIERWLAIDVLEQSFKEVLRKRLR